MPRHGICYLIRFVLRLNVIGDVDCVADAFALRGCGCWLRGLCAPDHAARGDHVPGGRGHALHAFGCRVGGFPGQVRDLRLGTHKRAADARQPGILRQLRGADGQVAPEA